MTNPKTVPPAQVKWNRINLIVGKPAAMAVLEDFLADQDNHLLQFDQHWGTCHHSHLKPETERLKERIDNPPLTYFLFTQSYEAIQAAAQVFGYDGPLSLFRVEMMGVDGVGLVAYDAEAFQGAMDGGLEVR